MTAKQAAVELGVLKYYPNDPQAVLKISKIIGSLLSDPQKVDRLVNEMTLSGRYNEWPGPATLVAECKAVRDDKPGPEYSLPEWEEPQVCDKCLSMGYKPTATGTYERCDCSNGMVLEEALLTALNRRSEKLGKRKGLTQVELEDFDATVLAAVRAANARRLSN